MNTIQLVKTVFYDPQGQERLDWAAAQCSDFTSALNLLARVLVLSGVGAELGAPLDVASELMWLGCPIIG